MENSSSRSRRDVVNKTIVLFVCTCGSFLTPLAGSTVVVALPRIANDLAMNSIQLSWVMTAYLLAAAVFNVPFGRLADISGRKRLLFLGVVIYTLSSLTQLPHKFTDYEIFWSLRARKPAR